ncbi:hypothetical protein SAMN05428995_101429 [Loktanella sp. DSM 29012]|nr:hypothetical protein SAMN05428995_101429 [Loktanella sp. DSM 29012]
MSPSRPDNLPNWPQTVQSFLADRPRTLAWANTIARVACAKPTEVRGTVSVWAATQSSTGQEQRPAMDLRRSVYSAATPRPDADRRFTYDLNSSVVVKHR